MKRLFTVLASWMSAVALMCAGAQVVTTPPNPLQRGSKDIVITFHADQGNKGMVGATECYAHTGVITTKSSTKGDWKHAPTWGKNEPKYQLENVGKDTWQLKIGTIAEYYGLTAEDGDVVGLAFVFRNGASNKEGKTATGGDIFVDVLDNNFGMTLTADTRAAVLVGQTTVNFTVAATAEADLALSVNGTEVKAQKGVTTMTVPYTFSGEGEYTVTATGTADGETVTQQLNYVYVSQAKAEAYPGGTPKMGAVKQEDGSVLFCLAAPGKESVVLVGEWDDYAPKLAGVMKYQDLDGQRYFWTRVEGLKNDRYYPYYYVVDGTLKVADPYAHLVLDCYSDKWLDDEVFPDRPRYPYDKLDDTMLAVYRGDLDDYDWQVKDFQIPDHNNLIIYEMLLRDFTGPSAEAKGTIARAQAQLNYLQDLNINAIELLPVMEFNGNNSWGYNTNFYMALDKAYGSPAELREFVDKCHERGIAVILDIVFNQSDGLHPWYQMYDIAENPFYNKTAPHDYSVLNDWRQDHPLVQQQWHDALRYWMEAYKVDGFRFDLVKGLGDNDSYGKGTEAENDSRVARMAALHATIKSVNPNGIHINENLAGAAEEIKMGNDGQLQWANVNNASCQFAMGYQSESDMRRFYAPLDGNRPWGTTVSYAESHDEERMAYKQTKWGATADVKTDLATRMRRLGSVAAQMLLAPGAHMIWQFGEMGADQTTKNADGSNNTDPKTRCWEYLNVPERHDLMIEYMALNHLRLRNADLFGPDASVAVSYSGWANGRTLKAANGNDELVLMVNPNTSGNLEITVPVSHISANNIQEMIHSHGFTPEATVAGGNLTCSIPAGAFAVFATGKVAGIDTATGVAAEARVAGGCGEIIIRGDYRNAQVYTLTGQAVGRLTSLTPGIYVVNVDGHTTKVAVR